MLPLTEWIQQHVFKEDDSQSLAKCLGHQESDIIYNMCMLLALPPFLIMILESAFTGHEISGDALTLPLQAQCQGISAPTGDDVDPPRE